MTMTTGRGGSRSWLLAGRRRGGGVRRRTAPGCRRRSVCSCVDRRPQAVEREGRPGRAARGGGARRHDSSASSRSVSRRALPSCGDGREGGLAACLDRRNGDQLEREYAPLGARVGHRFAFLPSSAWRCPLSPCRCSPRTRASRASRRSAPYGRCAPRESADERAGAARAGAHRAGVGIAVLDTGWTTTTPSCRRRARRRSSSSTPSTATTTRWTTRATHSCAGIAGGASAASRRLRRSSQ